MKDSEDVLIKPGVNTQAGRQIRITGIEDINAHKDIIIQYLFEAIKVEKLGLKVKLKKTKDYDVPDEFQERLNVDDTLKKAFTSLTPGRQRAYLLFFSAAKQSKTREARIKKYIPHILNRKGLNDH